MTATLLTSREQSKYSQCKSFLFQGADMWLCFPTMVFYVCACVHVCVCVCVCVYEITDAPGVYYFKLTS